MIKLANGKKYNLIGKGSGDMFPSFRMNYSYINWWLGNEPSSKNTMLKIIFTEKTDGSVTVLKKEDF